MEWISVEGIEIDIELIFLKDQSHQRKDR